jgi:hypothetical protein
LLVNPDANYQICIIGYDSLLYNLERIRSLLDSIKKEGEQVISQPAETSFMHPSERSRSFLERIGR